MKTSIKIAAAALLVAGSMTSAFAQTNEGGPGGRVHSFARPATHVVVTRHARSVAPHARQSYGAAVTPNNPNPNAVYENGKLIGQDPDANVRMMLHKDFTYQ